MKAMPKTKKQESQQSAQMHLIGLANVVAVLLAATLLATVTVGAQSSKGAPQQAQQQQRSYAGPSAALAQSPGAQIRQQQQQQYSTPATLARTTPATSRQQQQQVSYGPHDFQQQSDSGSAATTEDPLADSEPALYGSVAGQPGVDFPAYTRIPKTSFTCEGKGFDFGFYADEEAGCQVYHVCWSGRRESFICGVGTVFNQAILACDYWHSVDCSKSSQFYGVNSELGKASSEPAANSGPQRARPVAANLPAQTGQQQQSRRAQQSPAQILQQQQQQQQQTSYGNGDDFDQPRQQQISPASSSRQQTFGGASFGSQQRTSSPSQSLAPTTTLTSYQQQQQPAQELQQQQQQQRVEVAPGTKTRQQAITTTPATTTTTVSAAAPPATVLPNGNGNGNGKTSARSRSSQAGSFNMDLNRKVSSLIESPVRLPLGKTAPSKTQPLQQQQQRAQSVAAPPSSTRRPSQPVANFARLAVARAQQQGSQTLNGGRKSGASFPAQAAPSVRTQARQQQQSEPEAEEPQQQLQSNFDDSPVQTSTPTLGYAVSARQRGGGGNFAQPEQQQQQIVVQSGGGPDGSSAITSQYDTLQPAGVQQQQQQRDFSDDHQQHQRPAASSGSSSGDNGYESSLNEANDAANDDFRSAGAKAAASHNQNWYIMRAI